MVKSSEKGGILVFIATFVALDLLWVSRTMQEIEWKYRRSQVSSARCFPTRSFLTSFGTAKSWTMQRFRLLSTTTSVSSEEVNPPNIGFKSMKIYFIRKRSGSRKELGRHPFTFDETPGTLRQLLTAFTLHGLREAQAVAADLPLTEEEIAAQAVEGRVKFAERYGQNNDTPDRALQVMLRAFADGLVRIFVDAGEVTDLDAPLSLKEGSEVVFLRLTLLTGLMW